MATALVLAFLVVSVTTGVARSAHSAAAVMPAGMTAGVAVFDRRTGAFTERVGADRPFRSASVVKLLIALDVLWDRGPSYDLPPDDRARLEVMLTASDDDAASHYWAQRGESALVTRMVSRLGLQNTAGPPSEFPGYWGYSAITAADTVRIYRYLLDSAPGPVREFVMGNLRRSVPYGTDGFFQHFGIPAAFERPWAVKQGWSGFTSPAPTTGPTPDDRRRAAVTGIDLVRPALHTTGTVGDGDRSIVVALTLQPVGTTADAAYAAVDDLVRSLPVPGATPRRPPA
ncbi:hypothetical protein ACWD4B_19480 [Streptomyces sp. NPDC002536]